MNSKAAASSIDMVMEEKAMSKGKSFSHFIFALIFPSISFHIASFENDQIELLRLEKERIPVVVSDIQELIVNESTFLFVLTLLSKLKYL